MALVAGWDPTAPEGEQLPPELIEEIKRVAPSSVENGAITTPKLRDDAVTEPKLADAAVTEPKIAPGAVKAAGLANSAVTEPKIADDAVTPPKCGVGVVTYSDSAGNPISGDTVLISASDYAALSPPDPNITYDVYED